MLSSMRPAVLARWLWQPTQYWLGSELSRAGWVCASNRGTEHKRHKKHKNDRRLLLILLCFLCLLCSILFCLSSHQFFDQSDRARFRLTGMRGEEDSLSPVQRRPPFLVFRVEARAFGDKPFDDLVGSAVGGAHDCGNAHGIRVIDAHPEFVTKLHRFEETLLSL